MPSDEQLHRDVGAMEARLAILEKKQDEIARDVKLIRAALDEAKGGKKALWVLLSSAVALSSLLTAAATHFAFK